MNEGRKMFSEGAGREVTDLEMMQTPDWWPLIVWLPLKTGAPEWKVGLLISNLDGDEYAWLPGQSLYEPIDPSRATWLRSDELYTLIDDGWMVD